MISSGPLWFSRTRKVKAAVQLLNDGSVPETRKAVHALQDLGPAAKVAIPHLVAFITRPGGDFAVKVEAMHVVAALGEPGHPEIVRLCMAAEHESGRARGRGGRSGCARPSGRVRPGC